MGASSDFNGSSEVLVYNSGSVGPHKNVAYPFAIGGWIYNETASGGSRYAGTIAGTNDDQFIGHRTNSGNVFVACRGSTYGVDYHNCGTASTSAWNYAMIVVNGDTSRQLYINASQFGTTATALEPWANSYNYETQLGAFVSVGSGSFYFDGQICSWRVQNTNVSTAWMKEMMWNPFSNPSGFLWMPALWNESSTVGDFTDLSGNGWSPNGDTAPDPSTNGPPYFLLGGQ